MSISPVRWALAAFVSVIANLGVAHAQEPSVSFSLRGATDYVWRGVSQTDGNPAVFGTAQVNWNGFYAGAGAENVDFNNGVDTEYDLWAGWTTELAGFNLDVGFVRYGYIDAPSGADLDTLEAKVAVSHAVGPATLGAVVMYTDDYFAVNDSALYTEVNGTLPINDRWTVSGAVAYQQISGSDADYATWNLGVSYQATDEVSLDLRYHDNDADNASDIYDGRIVAAFRIAL